MIRFILLAELILAPGKVFAESGFNLNGLRAGELADAVKPVAVAAPALHGGDALKSAGLAGYGPYTPVTGDTRTGLIWITNPDDAGIGGLHTWPGAKKACNGLTYAGYSDWRLPTKRELAIMLEHDRNFPAINTKYFPDGQSQYYWSSTFSLPTTSVSWFIRFIRGTGDHHDNISYLFARCVRP